MPRRFCRVQVEVTEVFAQPPRRRDGVPQRRRSAKRSTTVFLGSVPPVPRQLRSITSFASVQEGHRPPPWGCPQRLAAARLRREPPVARRRRERGDESRIRDRASLRALQAGQTEVVLLKLNRPLHFLARDAYQPRGTPRWGPCSANHEPVRPKRGAVGVLFLLGTRFPSRRGRLRVHDLDRVDTGPTSTPPAASSASSG